MAARMDAVEPDVLERLRGICLELPETYEEQAWIGRRWMVRKKTFAHAFPVDDDSPPMLQKIRAVAAVPFTVITFRSSGQELRALRYGGYPFLYAGWGRDVIAMVLSDDVDWDEVRELLTESFCILAPKKLAAMVERPDG